ncbi:MAG: hypothetical protein CMO80_08860 [Verrucomicrobiales bacterium]|nr:hypothetical protein [Verrucomicrobiales bacterium]|tara:strand:+ start:1923 stop:2291 length:369 start_codon:yes stop_codon:yes gene_type:complete
MNGIEQLIPWSQPFLDEVNLRLHGELARIMKSETSVRARALQTVERWLEQNEYSSGACAELELWRNQLSNATHSELQSIMLDRSEEGVLHRSNSPFAGILSDEKRLQILEDLEHEIELCAAA